MQFKVCVGLAVFASMLTFPTAAWAAPLTFAPAVNYGTGSKPDSVAIGDLNGDGKLDLATANTASNSVSVLIGNGNGTFATAQSFGAGTGAGSVAIGDFNADNKLDLVTANTRPGVNSVSVLIGNGNGTFAAAVQYPVGTNPSSVAVGDLNGDGKLDLAAANSGGTTVSVLLGNGDGTLGAQTAYGGGAGATAIALGDLNNDGKADLITANPVSTRINVLLGNGDGTFGANSTPYGGDYPLSLALADLNGDGKLDLVVANVTISTVGVLIGNGNGGFGSPVNYAAGNGPVGVAISDLDADGKLDIAAANQRGDTVSVLRGAGDGSFASATSHPVGDGSFAVAIADLDGDGRRDVVTANVNSNNVSVLSNATASTFTTGPTATISGTATQGQTLTAYEGSPDPTPDSFTYEWFADGVTIGSQTAKTLQLTQAHVGKKISVEVTAKKAGYNDASDTSPETAAVIGTFTTGPTATISGTAMHGETLTADEGTPDPTPDSFTYEWFADGVTIGSQTAKTLQLTSAHVGKKISVTVTAKKAGLTDASDTSPETAAVIGTFTTGPTATISGSARQGQTLTADEGAPDPTPDSFSYEWFADGVTIGSQTAKTLQLTSAHVGKQISVKITAKKAGLTDASDTSPETVPVEGIFAPGPTASISGHRRVGSTLTANTGTPSPAPDSFAYRWFLDGKQLATKTKTLKLGAGAEGKRIRVKVYAIKTGYLTAADLSPATAPVSNLQAKTISMELNDYTVVRGQRVYAEIELLAPNESFSIVLDGSKLASGYANTKGVAVKAFNVPANATIGPRILRAYGKFTDRTDPDRITIR